MEKFTREECLKRLEVIHNKIKDHPFRKNFLQKDFLIGTWKSQLKEYKTLIWESTEIIANMIYRCTEPLEKEDGEWIHDFRHLLLEINYYHLNGRREEYLNEKLKSCDMSPREIASKTGIDDINILMLFFEKYISYIHIFIETKEFNIITGVVFEKVTEPHNGYYYEHLVEYQKIDGKWQILKEPEWIGSIPRKSGQYGE